MYMYCRSKVLGMEFNFFRFWKCILLVCLYSFTALNVIGIRLNVIGIRHTKMNETQSTENPAFDNTSRQVDNSYDSMVRLQKRNIKISRSTEKRPIDLTEAAKWVSSPLRVILGMLKGSFLVGLLNPAFFLTSFPFCPSTTAETRKARQDGLPSWSARSVTEP